MLSYKYKAMQVLGAVAGCARRLAATVLEMFAGGMTGLVFGILFLGLGVAGTRLGQE